MWLWKVRDIISFICLWKLITQVLELIQGVLVVKNFWHLARSFRKWVREMPVILCCFFFIISSGFFSLDGFCVLPF